MYYDCLEKQHLDLKIDELAVDIIEYMKEQVAKENVEKKGPAFIAAGETTIPPTTTGETPTPPLTSDNSLRVNPLVNP